VTADLSVIDIPAHQRPRVVPWCVWCDSALLVGDHAKCLSELDCSLWTPCLTCHGGRVDIDETACADCRGIGFWSSDSLAATFGGYTELAAEGIDGSARWVE
jgi:hypothetical protein